MTKKISYVIIDHRKQGILKLFLCKSYLYFVYYKCLNMYILGAEFESSVTYFEVQ